MPRCRYLTLDLIDLVFANVSGDPARAEALWAGAARDHFSSIATQPTEPLVTTIPYIDAKVFATVRVKASWADRHVEKRCCAEPGYSPQALHSDKKGELL